MDAAVGGGSRDRGQCLEVDGAGCSVEALTVWFDSVSTLYCCKTSRLIQSSLTYT